MPGGDRTGPMGQGPRTGRGAGYCSGAAAARFRQVQPGGGGMAAGDVAAGRRRRTGLAKHVPRHRPDRLATAAAAEPAATVHRHRATEPHGGAGTRRFKPRPTRRRPTLDQIRQRIDEIAAAKSQKPASDHADCDCQRKRRNGEDDGRHQPCAFVAARSGRTWPIWIATWKSRTAISSCARDRTSTCRSTNRFPSSIQAAAPIAVPCSRICRFGAIAASAQADARLSRAVPRLRRMRAWSVPATPSRKCRERSARCGWAPAGRSVSSTGTLNVGEAMSPPAIRAVKAAAPEADLVFSTPRRALPARPSRRCAAAIW